MEVVTRIQRIIAVENGVRYGYIWPDLEQYVMRALREYFTDIIDFVDICDYLCGKQLRKVLSLLESISNEDQIPGILQECWPIADKTKNKNIDDYVDMTTLLISLISAGLDVKTIHFHMSLYFHRNFTHVDPEFEQNECPAEDFGKFTDCLQMLHNNSAMFQAWLAEHRASM